MGNVNAFRLQDDFCIKRVIDQENLKWFRPVYEFDQYFNKFIDLKEFNSNERNKLIDKKNLTKTTKTQNCVLEYKSKYDNHEFNQK